MFEGKIVEIVVAPQKGAPTENKSKVDVCAHKGIFGDRYEDFIGRHSLKMGHPNSVTLIENETFEAIARDSKRTLTALECRRNLVTQGVPLNHLIGKEFLVGTVKMRGFELAEPCMYLENMLNKPVTKLLRHRGGLRAEILNSGSIAVGDSVTDKFAQ